jgi:hypothetical protein
LELGTWNLELGTFINAPRKNNVQIMRSWQDAGQPNETPEGDIAKFADRRVADRRLAAGCGGKKELQQRRRTQLFVRFLAQLVFVA